MDFLLGTTDTDIGSPLHHVLVVGVSSYDHLPGGNGALSRNVFAQGLQQLNAAAASAVRVASWFRDIFDSPSAARGTVRLLVSPQPGEVDLDPLPAPATAANVKRAFAEWRQDVRSHRDNVGVVYVAGHGIQTSHEGGILLLQDFGDPTEESPLDRAVDVAAYRRCVVGDPNRPETFTPQRQFYFYDACRVLPPAAAGYAVLEAGITCKDAYLGDPPAASWVSFGAKAREFALADSSTRTTLYSQALIDCLEHRAPPETDGVTVSMGQLHSALEQAVEEIAALYGEAQEATLGGAGKLSVGVHRRSSPGGPATPGGGTPDGGPPDGGTPIVFVSDFQGPVHIRDLHGQGFGEHGVEAGVTLGPGSYEAVIPHPWPGTGSDHVVPFTVDPYDERVDVDISMPWRALSATDNPLESWPDGALVRFLEWSGGWFRPLEPTIRKTLSRSPGGLRVETDLPAYLEIHLPGEATIVVALPTAGSWGCDVHLKVGTGPTADVRLHNPNQDAVSGYLTAGRPDRALTAFQLDELEMLLDGKLSDPFAATLAGYALLGLNSLDRMHDWPDNLAAWFTYLPDGAVIAGVRALRLGDQGKAESHFAVAAERGLPLFSRGLSLLADEGAAVSSAGPALDRIRSLAPWAAFNSLATSVPIDTSLGDGDHYVSVADLPVSDGQ